MFDFPVTEESIGTCLYCIFLYAIFLMNHYKRGISHCGRFHISQSDTRLLVIFLTICVITNTLSGDFFSMMNVVHHYNFNIIDQNYGEAIYGDITKLVQKNYLLFRTIVWGGAFLIFCYTARRLSIPVYYAAVYLFAAFDFIFCYARVTAAMAIYFLGVSFFCAPLKNYKFLGYLIGAFLICMSPKFHASAYILVVSTIMLFVPLRKWTLFLVIVATPIILSLVSNVLDYIIMADSTDEYMSTKLSGHLSDESQGGFSVHATLIRFFQYGAFILPTVIITYRLFKNKVYKNLTNSVFRLYKLLFFIVFVACSFFYLGANYFTLFYRVLNMAMIPVALLIPKFYLDGFITRRDFRLSVMFGIASTFIRLAYSLYNEILYFI